MQDSGVECSGVGCLYLYVFVLWLAGVRTVQCSELCTAVRSTAGRLGSSQL